MEKVKLFTLVIIKERLKPMKIRRRVPERKVSRACGHCKAAHVTCEEKRPCKRCIKKGLAGSCEDAPRKQRKYLLEATPNPPEDFQSSTMALEHARLTDLTTSRAHNHHIGNGLFESGFKQPTPSSGNGSATPDSPATEFSVNTNTGDSFYDTHINQYFIGTMDSMDGRKTYTFPQVVEELSQFKELNPGAFKARNRRSSISFSIGILEPQIDHHHNNWTIPTLGSPCGLLYSSPGEIYRNVSAPFIYVGPYHDLNVYLRGRFPREALIQMSKSMAEYRPSFIATMIRLKEQDLVFAEQCFQRTLLEYDEYIGLSGTPTIVWRRSSQIAYVSEEFTVLTGWTRQNLLDKSTFVVEIMDDKSCVEYFKLFSKLAFGDFKGATMTECTLSTPQNRGIRTACTWTLKRDVFGIPMMIIGSFLPILT